LQQYLAALQPQPLTNVTETDPRQIARAVAEARSRGIAQTVDQAADGVIGTAAAIRDAAGTVLGTLIVAAPSSRLADRGAELASMTLEEASAISRSLGYRAAVTAARPGTR
jgi:DNA-binding IclR family transcriptional regulator